MLSEDDELPFCSCGTRIPAHVRDCIGCGNAVGFPNVRRANLPSEEAALRKRVSDATEAAEAGRFRRELEAFGLVVGTKSRAVVARSLEALDAFISSDNHLMASFYKQVRAQTRVPEANRWDQGRTSADSAVNPIYHEELQYAALSLDGIGSKWYGSYHITLKDLMIASRSSVFEENPFVFCERKGVTAGAVVPRGYRASWPDRGLLAQAKLYHRLRPSMTEADFPAILLHQGTDVRANDFIEVHIYGVLHPSAIEVVKGPKAKKSDRALWRQVEKRLRQLGAVFEEIE